MATRIHITFQYPVLALPTAKAAQAIGISRWKLWKLRNLDESDPRKIKSTDYGTVPVSELERHLKAEMQSHEERAK